MSRINEIQQALQEIDGGAFQKMVDAYLTARDIGPINSIGSVTAANKVRPGTPDTLIATPEGKYIFAEHTTEKSALLKKMQDDLAKCFDETKTGIPVEKIARIIFCFTGKLGSKETEQLKEECYAQGVSLDLYGIDAISFDIYDKYPGIGRDFLAVEIDTGQIVPPNEFVKLYNKSRLATRLDTGFHFRDEELTKLYAALQGEDLVLVTGRPGVGKSRLVLEACRQFQETCPEYRVLCIFGRNRDLWEDIKVYFSRPGHFLIFVDDANRISSFTYIIDLLLHQKPDQKIKVIATVRDYALSKIEQESQHIERLSLVKLEPFSNDQIKTLIRDEYAISNHIYLQRIAGIAKGNPRLAVMAAEVAKQDAWSGITDVSSLYDSYFSSVRQDLQKDGTDILDDNLLRVAAIVSFFKAVDTANTEMMHIIEAAFSCSMPSFMESAQHLHELEILDIYENEVVKISDQVLGTYLFYLAVFWDKSLDFKTLLHHFFPEQRHRLIDSINPVLDAFDTEQVIKEIRPAIEERLQYLQEAEDNDAILHLLDTFWFVNRTDTLLWVKECISKMESAPKDISQINFQPDSTSIPSPAILSILSHFAFAEIDEAKMALDLLFDYLEKRPADVPFVLKALTEDYGFKPDSYAWSFVAQKQVVDELCKYVDRDKEFFGRMFLAVAGDYLKTHFQRTAMVDNRQFQITRFTLPCTPELTAIRKLIWERLFSLASDSEQQNEVLNIIREYCNSAPMETNSEIIKNDAELVFPFLESALDSVSYRHCVLMQDTLKFFAQHGVNISKTLKKKYRNETYEIANLLCSDWTERHDLDISHDEYEQYKVEQIAKYTAHFTAEDYKQFFDHCLEIQEVLAENSNRYQLRQGLISALLVLAERDQELYVRVVEDYLQQGEPFELQALPLVQKLHATLGYDATYDVLQQADFPAKELWLFCLYEVLPDDAVTENHLQNLFELYQTATPPNLSYNLDYLLKFLSLDNRVVAKVVSILLAREEIADYIGHIINMLFNPFSKCFKLLPRLFADDLKVLKQAYFLSEGKKQHNDYRGQAFNLLLDFDSGFATEYIAWKYENSKKGWLSSYDDKRDYTFLWLRDEYGEVLHNIINCIFRHEQRYTLAAPYLESFFKIRESSDADREKIEARQDELLLELVEERSQDRDFMEFLFGLLSTFNPERRYLFVECFVRCNTDFADFEHLPLEPSGWSWSGSFVPTLERRITFWKSLLPLMANVELLHHKKYIEQRIERLKRELRQEKKKDFIEA